jgi:hypothetical protein
MPQITADRRSYQIKLRSIDRDGGRHIEGHAAVFDTLSQVIWNFREVIRHGAFADAIARSDVRALWNHNPDYVLGRTKSDTLALREDERGLAVDIIPPDTQFARDLMTSMDRGDIDQMSFAFTISEDRWYTDESGMTIREIISIDQLFDVSPVTYPAYTETDVSARTQEKYKEFRAAQDAVGAGGSESRDDGEAKRARRGRELQLIELGG